MTIDTKTPPVHEIDESVQATAHKEETLPDQEAQPSFWKALGNFVVGAAIWAWFGFLYFTGGECVVDGLAIECDSGSLLTTINLPVAIVGLFFGLIAMIGGLVGMAGALTSRKER